MTDATADVLRDRCRRQWADAMRDFETSQRAAKYSDSIIAVRMKQLRRLVRERPELGPWVATFEDLRGWLDALPSGHHQVMQHRQSVRAFYGWAFRSGRILKNPTDEPSRRAIKKPIPDSWARELEPFARYLRGIGQPETTVSVRMSQLRRLAREISTDPLEVTFDDLTEWLAQKPWALETRRGHRHAIRGFFKWMRSTGRLTKNPAKNLPKVPVGHHLPRPASETEFAAAMAKAEPRERIALRLGGELGLRIGEIVRVHSSDLAGSSGEWWLVVHGKGRRQRRIPVTDDLAGAIAARGEGYLFPGQTDGHLSAHSLGRGVSALLPQGVAAHSLRHRFATRTYSVDRDVFSVQRLLGHSSPNTTQGYVKRDDGDLRRLVEAARPHRVAPT